MGKIQKINEENVTTWKDTLAKTQCIVEWYQQHAPYLFMSEEVAAYHVIVIAGFYILMTPSSRLRELVSLGVVTHWQFPYHFPHLGDCLVHMYYPTAQTFPNDKVEEINQRAIAAIEARGRK